MTEHAPPDQRTPANDYPATVSAPPRDRRNLGILQWLTVLAVAAVVGAAAGVGVSRAFPASATPTSPPLSRLAPGPALVAGASVPAIVSRVLPEVVSIDATGSLPGLAGGGPFGIGIGGAPTSFRSAGSGMIVSSSGLVLTNNHVVAGATSVAVTLHGQTAALPATVVGTDPSQDMALLRIDHPPVGLRAVTFGDSATLVPGDAVIAVGNALGLSAGSPTVTSGIVSALGRSVSATVPTTGKTETLTNMIQTDAPINPGNSGGPLVDSAGDVIGMNTAGAGTSSDGTPAQDIGFAIPSSELRAELGSLERGGTSGAPGAYLGVEVEDDSPALAAEYGFATASGAVVVAVEAGSPAAGAGLVPGDVIVAFDHHRVSSVGQLGAVEQHLRPGQRAAIQVDSGAAQRTVTVTLGTRPAA